MQYLFSRFWFFSYISQNFSKFFHRLRTKYCPSFSTASFLPSEQREASAVLHSIPRPTRRPLPKHDLSPPQHRPRRTTGPPGAWFTGLRSQISDSSHCTGRGTGESLELQGERHQIALAPLRQFIGNPDLLQNPNTGGKQCLMAGSACAFVLMASMPTPLIPLSRSH